MLKTIKLNGGKELTLTANAATPFRFKQLFGEDLLQILQKTTKAGKNNLEITETISQLAFVMQKQAEKADLSSVTETDFYAWLEEFEPMDFAWAAKDIISIYMQTTQPSVEAKKK